ncbi:sugar ABC transporter substrate-binding protein, partial [Mesorhizobium sp. M7A.F.Ca.CA.001.09.2.1]
MKLSRTSFALMATLLAGTALPTFANATVTVLGWPGGSEETALRATVETYN